MRWRMLLCSILGRHQEARIHTCEGGVWHERETKEKVHESFFLSLSKGHNPLLSETEELVRIQVMNNRDETPCSEV